MIASSAAGTPSSLQDLWWLVLVLILVGGGVLLSAAAWYANRPTPPRRWSDTDGAPMGWDENGSARRGGNEQLAIAAVAASSVVGSPPVGPLARDHATALARSPLLPRPMGIAVTLVLSAAVGWSVLFPPPGILQPYRSTVRVEHSLPAGTVMSVGIPLPLNTTGKDLRLRSVSLERLQGATIHGIGIHDPRLTGLGVGTAEGFPPAGTRLARVEGAVLGADRSTGFTLDVVVGISRDEGAAIGSFEAVLVDYELDGRWYRLRIPFSVGVHDPAGE